MDENDSKVQVEHITKEEIKRMIKKLKNNKSPGMDGFPGEFYKCFQAEIIMERVFNHALRETDPGDRLRQLSL